jgi:hypothetical protein
MYIQLKAWGVETFRYFDKNINEITEEIKMRMIADI